ncbi:MAG: hypothetical protein Q7J03_04290 [Methanoregula sp.]|nr:hypothetical protein [Methanoregula sp.]
MATNILTTNPGVPVTDNRNSLMAGQPDPALLEDIHLIKKQEMMV